MNNPERGNFYFLMVLLYQICIILALAVLREFGLIGSDINLILWSIGSQVLLFLPPLFIYLKATGQKISQAIPCEELDLMNIVFIVGLSILVQPLMMWISSVTSLFVTDNVSAAMVEYSKYPFAQMLFAIALVPAIFEEITMRGVVLANYSQVDVKKAALINGLLFGILHLNLTQMFYAAAMGVVFTYMVRYTRSIYASIMSHFIINGSQSLLVYWASNIINDNPELFETAAAVEYTFQEELMAVGAATFSALIFLPLFLMLMRSFIQYNKKRNMSVLLTEEVMTKLDKNPIIRPKITNWAFWISVALYVLYICEEVFYI